MRGNVNSIKDLKGKTVAASAPGTSPYFLLAWFLKKNGLSLKDVTDREHGAGTGRAGLHRRAATTPRRPTSLISRPCAQSRTSGKIIATTLDYPMVMDTFGCTPKFIAENEAAVKALTKSYFDALAMIKADEKKAYEIMGADVKQTGEAFGNSAKYLRWQDQEANKKFFAGEHAAFSKEAADLLLEIGVIKQIPDLSKLADPELRAVSSCSSPAGSGCQARESRARRVGALTSLARPANPDLALAAGDGFDSGCVTGDSNGTA